MALSLEDLEDAPQPEAPPQPQQQQPLSLSDLEDAEQPVVLSGQETTVPPEGDKGFFDQAVETAYSFFNSASDEAVAQAGQLSSGVASVVREPLKGFRLLHPLSEAGMKKWEDLFGEPAPFPLRALGNRISVYGDSMAAVGQKLTDWGVLYEAPPPTTTGQAVASAVGQAAASSAAGIYGAARGIAPWATSFAMGSTQSFGSSVEESQAMGASPEQQAIAAMSNAVWGGGTEAISGAYFLNRMNKATGGKLWEALKNVPLDTGPGPIKSAVTGFLTESSQEMLQTIGENVVASDIAGYDLDRPAGQNVKEAWTVGGIVGALFGGGTGKVAQIEEKKREEEMVRMRDNAINSLDPINHIGSSTAPFMPLDDRPDIQAKIGDIDSFLDMKGDEAVTALLANMGQTLLPKKFVAEDEQSTLGGRAAPKKLAHELSQPLDEQWHKDDAQATIGDAVREGKSRVILASTAPSPDVARLQREAEGSAAIIAEYDKDRKNGLIPAEMSDMEKSIRSDDKASREELARWEKLEEGKRRWMRHIADYVDRYVKAFDQVPGVNKAKIALLPSSSTSLPDYPGVFVPAADMQRADGSTQPYDMLAFNLDTVLNLRSPDTAKDFTKRDALELFESVNHELGHWLSYRYFQETAQKYNDGDFSDATPEGRQNMKEFAAIVQDYAKWYKSELQTPLGGFLAKQRGVALGQEMQRVTNEGGYPGTTGQTPAEKAFDLTTAFARAGGDKGGRDYFFNFAEYMAHRMERMAARPGDNKVENELGETIEPGIFKSYFEGYEKVFSDLKADATWAGDANIKDTAPHVWDQFIRRLSLKNQLIEDARERMTRAPSTLSDSLKGKVAGFDPNYWGGFQENWDDFTDNIKRYNNLLQWAWRNPHVQGLQTYSNIVSNHWSAYVKNVYYRESHTLLKWRRLGKEGGNRVSNVLLEEAEQEERYTPQEIQARLTEAEAEVYYTFRKDMDFMLKEMEDLSIREATRGLIMNQEMLDTEVAKIRATYAEMKQKGYVPFLRFGKYVVQVRAATDMTYEGKNYKKNQVVSWEAFDHKWEQENARASWQAAGGSDFLVGKSLMNEHKYATQAMPLPMLKLLRDKVPVAAQPEIDDAIKNALPTGSFKRRFLKKRGIRGYSKDLQRSYATYMKMGAGHISRVKHAEDMLDAIRQVGQDAINITNAGKDANARSLMHQGMQAHYEYIMNPGNELQSVRAAGFFFLLGFNIKSAVINLLQVPQVGYPYLAGRFGDAQAVAQLAKAMKDNVSYWTNRDSWLRSSASAEQRKLSYVQQLGNGAYAIDGTTAFDPAVPSAKFFDLSKVRLADMNNPEVALEVMQKRLEHEKSEVTPDAALITALEQSVAAMQQQHKTLNTQEYESLNLEYSMQSMGYEGAILEDVVQLRQGLKTKIPEISDAQRIKRKDAPLSERKGEIVRMIQTLQANGTLDQSLAMEIAIASSESRADRLAPLNKLELLLYKTSEYGALPFHVAEKLNRQVMAMAAYNLARDQGYNERHATNEAQLAVQKSMYEHAQWNRPEFMRGKKSVFFLFYNYVQNTAYFATRGDSTALRYWLMLGLMSGIMGLPFAEDLEELIDFVATKLKRELGSKNPKTQIRMEMRDLINEMNMNPDLLLHGFAQNSFGLPALGQLAGIPDIPSFDLSRSIGMGNIIPGTGAPEAFAERGVEAGITQLIGEMGGAAVGVTEDILRAAYSDNPNTWKRTEGFLPTFAKSASKSARMWQEGGEKTAAGNVIAEFDPFEPKDQMELVGQALGFGPSRVTRGWERYMAEKELVNYYELHKAKTLKQFYHAVYTEDREGIKDAQEGITQYNKTVPYPEMGINAKTVREGTRRYIDSQLKNEKGVSGRKTYRLEQSVRELYPEADATSIEGTAPTG